MIVGGVSIDAVAAQIDPEPGVVVDAVHSDQVPAGGRIEDDDADRVRRDDVALRGDRSADGGVRGAVDAHAAPCVPERDRPVRAAADDVALDDVSGGVAGVDSRHPLHVAASAELEVAADGDPREPVVAGHHV